MSQPVPDVPGGRPPAPKSRAFTAALEQIRSLWHYLPDYDYRPDLFVYAEFHTTDPGYVVVGVGDVAPTPAQFHYLSADKVRARHLPRLRLRPARAPPSRGPG